MRHVEVRNASHDDGRVAAHSVMHVSDGTGFAQMALPEPEQVATAGNPVQAGTVCAPAVQSGTPLGHDASLPEAPAPQIGSET